MRVLLVSLCILGVTLPARAANCIELTKALRDDYQIQTTDRLESVYGRLLEFDWQRLNQIARNENTSGELSGFVPLAGAIVGIGAKGNHSKAMTKLEWDTLHSKYMETHIVQTESLKRISQSTFDPALAEVVKKCLDTEHSPEEQYWLGWSSDCTSADAVAKIVYRPLRTGPKLIRVSAITVTGGRLLEPKEKWIGRKLRADETLLVPIRRNVITNPEQDGFENLHLDIAFIGPPVRSLELSGCARFRTGACCLADGTCIDSTQSNCVNQSGTYKGAASVCANGNCPQPSGACCIKGNCSIKTRQECASSQGKFHGIGSSCTDALCKHFVLLFEDHEAVGVYHEVVNPDQNNWELRPRPARALFKRWCRPFNLQHKLVLEKVEVAGDEHFKQPERPNWWTGAPYNLPHLQERWFQIMDDERWYVITYCDE